MQEDLKPVRCIYCWLKHTETSPVNYHAFRWTDSCQIHPENDWSYGKITRLNQHRIKLRYFIYPKISNFICFKKKHLKRYIKLRDKIDTKIYYLKPIKCSKCLLIALKKYPQFKPDYKKYRWVVNCGNH